MSEKNSNIPKSLVDAIKAGEVVPFVGAGVSLSVRKGDESLFPSWKTFLLNAAEKLGQENKPGPANVIKSILEDSPPDYLYAAQRAFDALGQAQWYDLLRESFEIDIDSADEESLELARLIWNLGSNFIVSTNVDLVLQSVHESPHKVKILDTQAPEFAELQKNWKPPRPTVLHLHGHIDNKANVVFTADQYEAFYNLDKNQAKLETLRSLFTQRTILFTGYSLDDLFILKELEKVSVIYEGGANSFYVLIRESEKDNPNIPKYVEKIVFSDIGEPLLNLIKDLIPSPPAEAPAKPAKDEKRREKADDKPFFNVPYNSKGKEFVGRAGKLEEIWDLFGQEGIAAIGQAVSVRGFGGLGKTQLAVEYAHEYRDKYKNGVFWLVADKPIDNQLLQIGDELGWTAGASETVNQLDAAKAKFLELSECLILFDNVIKYDDVRDYLPKPNLQTHILITSREKISEFRPIFLEFLDRIESRELLLRVSNRRPQDETEQKNLESILEMLGDIPLAIELVGGYLFEHVNITFSEYFHFLEETSLSELEEEFPKDSFTKHDRSIIQTLRISEEIIKEKPLVVEILKVLAWSGNSSMGISLLRALVAAENDFKFKTALGDAINLRVLKKDENDERYAIHRLLAKVLRYENPLENRKEWLEKIVENLEDWGCMRLDKFENLAEFESELEHLKTWQEEILETLPAKSVVLLRLKGNIPAQRGLYREAFDIAEEALNLFQKEKLTEKSIYADILNDLGTAYGHLGKHEKALKYKLDALEIRTELFGEKHPDTANSVSNVGLTYGDLGQHAEAFKYRMRGLEIRRELFGEKHRKVATSLNDVGSTYNDLGKPAEALKYQLQALEIARELLGEKHPETAALLNNISVTYGNLGKYDDALTVQLQATELYRELYGEKHPDTATMIDNVGGSYGDLGKYDDALKYQLQALEIRRELFGEKHPGTAYSLDSVGLTYGNLGKYDDALTYQLQAVEIRREFLGEKHPITAISFNNVGIAFFNLGKYKEALEYFLPSLKTHQELLGKQHPTSIIIARNLIDTYFILKNDVKARKLAREFLSYIPKDHAYRQFFEENAATGKQSDKKIEH